MLLVKNERMARDGRQALPKTRLCAEVLLSLVFDAETYQVKTTIRRMQSRLGNGWSATSAVQFLSGRQAEVAIGRSLPEERPAL
ncbi:hypothetical protein ACMHYO_11570 [Allopusillimonas ginsengisoli]|uniref:hypothetical protein n=1 Tax=Allopusillimonas ginsengisoli TaxID=453575 RepID=UPI0039C2E971